MFGATDNNDESLIDEHEFDLYIERHKQLVDQNPDGTIDETERKAPAWYWGGTSPRDGVDGRPAFDWPTEDASTADYAKSARTAFDEWDLDRDHTLSTEEVAKGIDDYEYKP